MSHVWAIVQKHIDTFGVREAEIARRMGTAPQTLNSWKKRGLTKLPDAALILGLSEVTRTPYAEVLEAVLMDIRYLPKEVVERDRDSAPSTPAGPRPATRPKMLRPNQAPVPLEADPRQPIGGPRERMDSPPRQAGAPGQ